MSTMPDCLVKSKKDADQPLMHLAEEVSWLLINQDRLGMYMACARRLPGKNRREFPEGKVLTRRDALHDAGSCESSCTWTDMRIRFMLFM